MNPHEPIIVIVDPDAERATALSVELDRRGYHVFRRSCGIDALECAAEYRPDLVLSEMELLDFESPELLRSIHEASPSTKVLFVQHQAAGPRPPVITSAGLLKEERLFGELDEITLAVDEILEQ
jgi:two-component system response regulator GlrR